LARIAMGHRGTSLKRDGDKRWPSRLPWSNRILAKAAFMHRLLVPASSDRAAQTGSALALSNKKTQKGPKLPFASTWMASSSAHPSIAG
jgi:hypothetical protein